MRKLPSSVLFVCYLNAIRSPIAEGLMKKLAGREVYVQSAGMAAAETDDLMIAIMAEKGIDMSQHRARKLADLDDKSFDVVIAFTESAGEAVKAVFAGTDALVEVWPLPDPTAGSLDVRAMMNNYRAVRDNLEGRLKRRFEMEIHALVMAAGLGSNVTYVSWVPEALYQIHAIAPDVPLCLSHWCKNPHALIRAHHKVHVAKNNKIPPPSKDALIHGIRSGYFVDGPLRGQLRDIIRKTGGSVCVPQDMVSAELTADYHAEGITLSSFSYINWPAIMRHEKEMSIDLYFIDNKGVFDAL